MKNLLLVLLLAAASLASQAQSIPVNTKFGAVSDAELELTEYAQDTSAAVLVLYRHRDVLISLNGQGEFYRKEVFQERVKILKESGKSYPEYKLYYREPQDFVTDIKVVTYNMSGGRKTTDKLSKKMIFDEEVSGNIHSVSFAAENVRVGSVVEVTYTQKNPRIADFDGISLQDDVPLNLCEATVAYIPCFIYNIHKRGTLSCVNYRELGKERVNTSGGGVFEMNQVIDHYRAYNVPAMKDAPRCYCPDFYKLAYDYDLRAYDFDGEHHQDYSTTWENVDDQVRKAGIIKEFYDKSRIEAGPLVTDDEVETITRIRNLVCALVTWNGKRGISPQPAKAFKAHEGNACDIAALVAECLGDAGYKIVPVFLMTRDRGEILDHQVKIDAFNTVVLQVTGPSGKVRYIDPASAGTAVDVMAGRCTVKRARVIPREGAGKWVDLSKLSSNRYIRTDTLSVTADGIIHGRTAETGFNSNAGDMKAAYSRFSGKADFISQIETDCGIEIDSLRTEGMDKWGPQASVHYTWQTPAVRSGDLLYIRPFVDKLHTESTFRSPERMVPVDFPFSETGYYSVTIDVPEGWAVESLPPTVYFEEKNVKCQASMRAVSDGEHTVSVNLRYSNGQLQVPVDEYQEFRKYWERLCGIYNVTIVLKKI